MIIQKAGKNSAHPLQSHSKNEQYAEKFRDFKSKSEAAATSVNKVLGRNALIGRNVIVKKSHYEGAINEGSKDNKRQYNRGDILKPFQQEEIAAEKLAKEFAKLRQKQIDVQQLTEQEKLRFDELEQAVQPVV